MGDGAAGSRVTVRVRLGLVLVLILLSYLTCPQSTSFLVIDDTLIDISCSSFFDFLQNL